MRGGQQRAISLLGGGLLEVGTEVALRRLTPARRVNQRQGRKAYDRIALPHCAGRGGVPVVRLPKTARRCSSLHRRVEPKGMVSSSATWRRAAVAASTM